tara:strand:+ start:734 stop:937 length:204 start_codon:yes stop_codon:yes gene_type:complete
MSLLSFLVGLGLGAALIGHRRPSAEEVKDLRTKGAQAGWRDCTEFFRSMGPDGYQRWYSTLPPKERQ